MSHKDKISMIDIMQQCQYFKGLSRDQLMDIVPFVFVKHMQPGDVLFEQGDPSHHLFIVESGKLHSVMITPNEGTITIGAINPGEAVGELGALSGEPRSMTVKAVVASVLLQLPSRIFVDICQEYPSVMEDMSKLIVNRSLRVIDLIARKNKAISAVIIVIDKNSHTELLYQRLKSGLGNPQNEFHTMQGKNEDEILEMMQKAQQQGRNHYLYMEKFEPEVINNLSEILTHIYIVTSANSKLFFENKIKAKMAHISHIPNIRTELVLIHDRHVLKPKNTKKWLAHNDFILHHHIRDGHEGDYQRLLRFITGRAHALVLGGGAAKGIAHVAVIKAMLDSNIPIDAIGGTSVGAGMGLCYITGDSYAHFYETYQSFKILSQRSIRLYHLTWPVISFFSGNPLTNGMQRYFLNTKIEDLWLPYFCISSNITTKQQNIHRQGLAWEALRSSSAIPGVLPPFVKNFEMLYDGGLLNNLPVDVMRELLGRDGQIFASSLQFKNYENVHYEFPTSIPFFKGLISKLTGRNKSNIYPPLFETVINAMLLGASLKEKHDGQIANLLFAPDLSQFRSLSQYRQGEEDAMFTIAYNHAMTKIAEYKKALSPTSARTE